LRSRLAYGFSLLLLIAGSTYAFATIESSHGPIASVTDAPAIAAKPAELVCTLCHFSDTNNLNVPGGGVHIGGVPIVYAPNQIYAFTVRLKNDSTAYSVARKWGFQITAVRASDGEGAGTFILPDPDTLQIVLGSGAFASRSYLEHTSIGTRDGLASPVTWHFSWQAPSTKVGKIYFFCAGNSADGSQDPSGDWIFTTSDSTVPSSNTGVPVAALGVTSLGAPSPNPSRGEVRMDYSLARGADIDLAIFDVAGRRVRALGSGWREAGAASARWDGARDDGTRVANGTYFARLKVAGEANAITRKVLIAR